MTAHELLAHDGDTRRLQPIVLVERTAAHANAESTEVVASHDAVLDLREVVRIPRQRPIVKNDALAPAVARERQT